MARQSAVLTPPSWLHSASTLTPHIGKRSARKYFLSKTTIVRTRPIVSKSSWRVLEAFHHSSGFGPKRPRLTVPSDEGVTCYVNI
ncbi:hypothetical protein J6590_099968 [Homalodisca vitripennis]|nr:hypothetical protein J6590_099968 [Homalodisca vitripennis]